jgi:hypothetical protein
MAIRRKPYLRVIVQGTANGTLAIWNGAAVGYDPKAYRVTVIVSGEIATVDSWRVSGKWDILTTEKLTQLTTWRWEYAS